MYPYIKLLQVGWRSLTHSKDVSISQETSVSFRVWPQDIDVNIHMNNGRYLTIMDIARFDYVEKTGLMKAVLRNKWYPVLGAAQMVYLKSLKLFQPYTIFTALECWDEKWFIMSQRFESYGKICAYGKVRGLFRSRDGNVTPNEIFTAAGLGEIQSPEPSETTRLWLAMLEAQKNNNKDY